MNVEALPNADVSSVDTLAGARWARAEHEAGRHRDRTPARLVFVWSLVQLGKFATAEEALAALDRQAAEHLEERTELRQRAARERFERAERELLAAMDLRDAEGARLREAGEDPDSRPEFLTLAGVVREKGKRALRALYASAVERLLATSPLIGRLLDDAAAKGRDRAEVAEKVRRGLLSENAFNDARAAATDGLFRITDHAIATAGRVALSERAEIGEDLDVSQAAVVAAITHATREAVYEHRAPRAIRSCTPRVRRARRTCTSTREGPDGDGEPARRRSVNLGHPLSAHARISACNPAPAIGRTVEVRSAPRPIQQITTAPHGAPRGCHRGLTRQIDAEAKMRFAPGGNRGRTRQTAERRAGSGPGPRFIPASWPAEQGGLHALAARRAPAY